jgi:hypothetical protein
MENEPPDWPCVIDWGGWRGTAIGEPSALAVEVELVANGSARRVRISRSSIRARKWKWDPSAEIDIPSDVLARASERVADHLERLLRSNGAAKAPPKRRSTEPREDVTEPMILRWDGREDE